MVFVLLGFLAIPVSAFAHPVILITYTVGFRFDSNELQGFTETWWFDQVHSQQILQMFDANHNGQIDPGELPALKAGYFEDLRDYNFFSSVVLNGKAIPTKAVADFSARFENHTMVYRFFVPLKIPVAASGQELDLTVWDPTYFTDLSPRGSDPFTLDKPAPVAATVSTADDHRHFYHIAPDIVIVKKPPFYLKMIVVRFKKAG